MKKKVLSVLLAACLLLALLPVNALAQEDVLPASPSLNANANDYTYNRWANPVNSYLYANQKGGYTRVEYIYESWYDWDLGQSFTQDKAVIEDYDDEFYFQSARELPMELPIWGGFFAGEDYNFVAYGQSNRQESGSQEVIRIVKYSKDWQRLGDCRITGANTTVPFDAGSLRWAEYGGMLYIRTCHEMYASPDGINHQANVTLQIQESGMRLVDHYWDVMNVDYGYISHSFNQFILIDSHQNIVAADHGDAHPRAVVLQRYFAKAGANGFTGGYGGWCDSAVVQEFPGATGDNTTGASLGGLAETSGGYLTAYNYNGTGGSGGPYYVYLGYTPKNGAGAKQTRVSDTDGGTPMLVSTGLDGGYILWNLPDAGMFCYARYSADGSVGQVQRADGLLSDCQPIYHDGQVIWYTTQSGLPVFYTLDESGVKSTRLPFEDVSDTDWFRDAARYTYERGIMGGTGDGTTFSPNGATTRAQLVTMLYRMEGEPAVYTDAAFTDLTADWYKDAVLWAADKEIVTGVGNGRFHPNGALTRRDMALILKRYAEYKTYDTSPRADLSKYKDASKAGYAEEALSWANAAGLITGTSETTLAPLGGAKRGQTAAVLMRFCKSVAGTTAPEDPSEPEHPDPSPNPGVTPAPVDPKDNTVQLKWNGEAVCTVTLPESWNQGYVAKENNGFLGVYDQANHDAQTGSGGYLFGLKLFGSSEYVHFPGHSLLSVIQVHGKTFHLVAARPTDVQYDTGSSIKKNSYEKKWADVEDILKDIQYTSIVEAAT